MYMKNRPSMIKAMLLMVRAFLEYLNSASSFMSSLTFGLKNVSMMIVPTTERIMALAIMMYELDQALNT